MNTKHKFKTKVENIILLTDSDDTLVGIGKQIVIKTTAVCDSQNYIEILMKHYDIQKCIKIL